METKCKFHNLQFDMNGTQLLTLAIQGDFRPYIEEFADKDLKCEIKPFKGKRRSLSANAYAWVLIDKLAERLNLPPQEVYKNAIRHIGGVSETICIQNRAVEKFCEGWQKNGIGWQTEIIDSKLDGCSCVVCYYGSSTYDSTQMKRLIDIITQDCKAVGGIETLTPAELERMCAEWQ
jgi:hypothetical protein